jgi:glycosyltransferase involved in cell wall biosynthesis
MSETVGARAPVDGDASPSSRVRLLHVVVQVGPTNSQWNEHCLPVAAERDITVCSLFPATVVDDPRIVRFEGDGSVRGALRALRTALRHADYDVVHVHAPASAALLLCACALERRRWDDVVFTVHNSWQNLRARNKVLAAVGVAAFPVVVACSRSAVDSFPRAVRRLAPDGRVAVVCNGVDVDRVDQALSAAPGPPPGPGTTVVTVGRLIPIKDQAALLTAFAGLAGPDDHLLVIGEGPLRAELEQLARALGIADQVKMPGLLARDEVYRMLARADVYVSSSHGEGLPLSVLEALAAGLPTVLTDIPPHRELAGSNDAVRLVPVGDAKALTETTAHLLRMPAPDRVALGRRGRQSVVDRFSVGAMNLGYRSLYASMSTRTQRPSRETT